MKTLFFVILISSVSFSQEISSYLGLNLGLHNSSGSTQEQNKSGSSLNGKIVGSYENENGYIDLGLGYQYLELTAKGVKVITKSISSELEYRYKLNQWSFGPSLKLVGGTDNSNSETVGSTTITTNLLLKAVLQTKMFKSDARLELGLGSSVGLERNISTVLVGFQIGLPFKHNLRSESKKEVSDLKIDLKIAQVKFNSDKFQLSSLDESKLKRLAKFLKEHNSEWSRIKISGHTDILGDESYNKALSQDRADSVMKVFILAGVNETKMTAHGFGSSRPVNNDNSSEAFAQNRRTEIEFFGLSNRNWFNKKIEEMLK